MLWPGGDSSDEISPQEISKKSLSCSDLLWQLWAAALHKLCITWMNSCFRVILLSILHRGIKHWIFNIQSSNLLLRLLFPCYWGVMCPQDKNPHSLVKELFIASHPTQSLSNTICSRVQCKCPQHHQYNPNTEVT